MGTLGAELPIGAFGKEKETNVFRYPIDYLNAGMGKPWAGHVSEAGPLAMTSTEFTLIGALGPELPTGSEGAT